MSDSILNIFICAIGLALHFAMKWGEERRTTPLEKEPPGLLAYINSVPAQSLIALLATVGVFTVSFAMGWMDPGMAFASGYMGHSMAENLANQLSKPHMRSE